MDHLDYPAPNGDRWRVAQVDELCRDYSIARAGIPDWHKVMCGIGQAWECLCRRYGVFEILRTTDPDRMRPATVEVIARALGLKTGHVEDVLGQAVDYWRKYQRRTPTAGSGLESPSRPMMDDEEVARVLAEYDLKPADADRKAVARRLVELRSYLDNDLLRAATLSLIQQEQNLSSLDVVIGKEREKTTPDGKELRELLKARAALTTSIEQTQERLGIWDTPDVMRKRAAFADCLGTLTLGVQEHYAVGSNELLDGVSRELEVELLLTEYDLRKPQYRPDLPGIVSAAIEGLWDPNFKLPPLPRHAARYLAAGFRAGVAGARQEDGREIPELDADPDADSD